MEEKIQNNKKRKMLYIVIIIGIVCIALVCWNKIQEDLFFHPWNDYTSYKKMQKIDEFKEIEIKNDEVNLSGWFWNIQGTNEKKPLVIFFTGNAQNSSNTLYNYYLSGTMKDNFGDYNLMIVDYPGYGISKGKPSDDSMFIASNYIFEYAKKMEEVDSNKIVIMGYSIGTGVASFCASKNEASGLILIAPYDKALSLYNDAVDSFHGSFEKLAKYSFNSASYAENVDEQTIIFTSKSDEVINYSHSLDLAGHFSNLYDVVILDGVNHNGYFSQIQVLNGIKDFLNMVK